MMLNTNKNTTDSRARHRINAKPLRSFFFLCLIKGDIFTTFYDVS